MWQFIIGVRPHNVFGYTVSAYWIEPVEQGFYRVIQNILVQDVEAQPDLYSEEQKQIVRLIEEISENNIYRKFLRRRKTSFQQFYRELDKTYLEHNILPFIGERMAKIFRLAYWGNVRIFLKSYRYDKIYKDDELFYIFDSVEPVFYFEKTENQIIYRLDLVHRGQKIDILDKNITFLVLEPCHFVLDGRIYHADNLNCKKIKPFISKKHIVINSKIEDYLQRFVKNTVKNYKVIAKGFEIQHIHPKKRAVLSLEYTINKVWGFVLKLYYNDNIYYPLIGEKKIVYLIKEPNLIRFITFERDFSWEENIVYALKHAGLRQGGGPGIFYLPDVTTNSDLQLKHTINWLNKNYDLLESLQITVEQHLDKKFFTKKIDLNLKITKKIDWFDIYATVRFGQYEIPFIDLRDYILQGKREFLLPDGQIAIIPEEWFAKYKHLFLFGKKDRKTKNIKLLKSHFTILEKIEDRQVSKDEIFELIEKFKKRLWQPPQIPQTITAKLRNYQKQGVAWIYTLYKNNFGGCLADDMGLGKTLQVITAIAKAMDEYYQNPQDTGQLDQKPSHQLELFDKNGKRLHNLIIVPKSLIHNWINEFKKFAPSYSIISYTGTYRSKLHDELLNHDFIITSYGVVRNDIDFLSQMEFFYVVLDESQYIKNPNSKIYQAVRKLNAKHKMILTGTPIENSLTDLWTQMNFINPGLLGSYNFFRKYFISQIERAGNEEVKAELKQLISPFILRRTKQEVVKDLPDLIEQTVYCEMTPDQHLIYENEKSKIRNEILKIYQKGKLKETSIYILRALTRLRQIANHPRIINKSAEINSGKFEIVKQKIETVIDENHKVLIFSSFVRHLEIYRDYIEKRGWKYAMLTGESEHREDIISKFQKNDDIKIFLISLKAGGVGLNLTAADYVFLLDPWWNPATEQQAISRAHRIGQTNNVFVYRFITVGSVEEKIQLLQQKKRKLFKEFVDSANIFAQLSEENIVQLFE